MCSPRRHDWGSCAAAGGPRQDQAPGLLVRPLRSPRSGDGCGAAGPRRLGRSSRGPCRSGGPRQLPHSLTGTQHVCTPGLSLSSPLPLSLCLCRSLSLCPLTLSLALCPSVLPVPRYLCRLLIPLSGSNPCRMIAASPADVPARAHAFCGNPIGRGD